MEKLGILARLTAKPGKEKEVADLLTAALDMANAETQTIRWYGFQLSSDSFGIFDTFTDESGRRAHLEGPIAQALMAKAGELLAVAPVIEQASLLAVK